MRKTERKPGTASKGELTRERMISEAIRLFAKTGFSETSFQDIGSACGLSRAAAFKYFDSKADLIQAVIDRVVRNNHDHVTRLIESQDDAHERLCKYFRGNLSWALSYPEESQIVLLLYYFSCFSPEFSEVYLRLRNSARRRLLEYVHAGQREGLFRSKAPALAQAELLHDAVLGSIVNCITVERVSKNGIPAFSKKTEKQWAIALDSITGFER